MASLTAVLAYADGISSDQALQYARKFFSDTPSAQLSIVWTGNSASKPSFYVINRKGGGFVILSGDNIIDPLVGYSYTNTFTKEGMPEHLRSWFNEFENDLAQVREMQLPPEKAVLDKWDNLGIRTKASGKVEIESAQWDQGSPYNAKCIMPDGSRAVTGCVATAMAITLRHNKYPAHGYGTLSSYTTSTYKYRIAGFSIEDHVYNWDLMPLVVNNKSITEEEKEQISQLMYDCGVMIQMDYSPSGSGAVSMYMPSVMAEHLAYNPKAMLFRKSMYRPKEWFQLLKQELDKDKLVFYSGHDTKGGGGHAFVIDGYDEENTMLRVNWGWGGSNNGYYNLDLEVGKYRFANDNGAVLGLEPDPDRTGQALTHLALTGGGLSLTSGKIAEGKNFSVQVNSITNYGNADFDGAVVVVLTDENDNIKTQLSSPKNVKVPALSDISTSISNCKLETSTLFKDRVALAAKNPETGEYEVLRRDVEAETVGSLATIPNFIAGKSSYSAGEVFDLKLFKSGEPFRSVTWYLDGEIIDKDEDSIVLTAGSHEIKAVLEKNNGTETIVKELDVL